MAHAEQICRKHANMGPAVYRYLKRRMNKLWRKWARRDPEGAPTRRPIKGWCD